MTSALNADGEGTSDILAYICTGFVGRTVKTGTAHYYYRGPHGEVVTHLGEAGNTADPSHYKWKDMNGEQREARSRIGRKPLRIMPFCPQHRRRTKFHRTYHLTIVKGGDGRIGITLSECDGPPHHYIRFGPMNQIARALSRVKGKKGRYELDDGRGKLIQTEWVASAETRKALSLASTKGWRKGRKKRLKAISDAYTPKRRRENSDRLTERHKAAKAEVARIAEELAQAKRELAKVKAARAESRRKVYTPEDIGRAIESVRKTPYAANRTAMQALNISEAGLHRWLKDGKLKRYKKGFVYSVQILHILDRPTAKT